VNLSIVYSNDISDHKNSLQRFNKANTVFSSMNNHSDLTTCNLCKTNQAEIFQENGDYCLHCWQEITFPNV
jgi:hypothetical protein